METVSKLAAETKAAPIVLPRRVVTNKVRVTDPGFQRKPDQMIADLESSYVNTSIRDMRGVNTNKAIRALTRFNGIFSTAVHSYIQMAMSGFKVTGYAAGTHAFDPVATNGAISILAATDTLYDYTIGFADKQTIDGMLETLLKEVLQTGGCSLELVLNQFILPERMIPVPVTSLQWLSTKEGTKYPRQQTTTGGDPVSLNIPTFFYAAMHQVSDSIFPRSPLESALQMIYVYTEFLEDLSRVIHRSGHSRMVVKVIQEAVAKDIPMDIAGDPVKVAQYYEDVRSSIEAVITSLGPDDAIVTYDTAEVDILHTAGEKADYTALLKTLGSQMAASLKSMPSMLGLGEGSQNLATAEAMVFLKLVRSIQVPVEAVMSRAITLAVRLATGTDSYCKFKFQPINIRPDSELSAHNSVMFQQELHKLSLGLYTDDEFAHIVGSGPRAPGAPPLSGTLFMDQSAVQPKDMSLNTNGQARNLNEGTAQGSPTSQGGGAPA